MSFIPFKLALREVSYFKAFPIINNCRIIPLLWHQMMGYAKMTGSWDHACTNITEEAIRFTKA